jgi:hypothetical protein
LQPQQLQCPKVTRKCHYGGKLTTSDPLVTFSLAFTAKAD